MSKIALNKGKKVFVGMSGGVDSSVSACLLKEQGYDVTGVFIKSWHPDFMVCNWKEERRDAMRVAAHLEIPFLTCDLEEVYKTEVIDYMISEYKKGRTPNPDVMCNKYIKFGSFLDWAKKQGADYVATGHYAQIISIDGKKTLATSPDSDKDQTYFVWTLPEDHLNSILFPIGHLTKPQLRKVAAEYELPTSQKKDSQGLCFLGKVDMKDFLSHYIKETPGDVQNQKGEVIGSHVGALFYTLGERHGFEIFKKSTDQKPMYIVAKDISKNILIVSEEKSELAIEQKEIELHDVVLRHATYKPGDIIKLQYRYHGAVVEAKIISQNKAENTLIIEPINWSERVAPGQSIVMYKRMQATNSQENICIGGGIVHA